MTREEFIVERRKTQDKQNLYAPARARRIFCPDRSEIIVRGWTEDGKILDQNSIAHEPEALQVIE